MAADLERLDALLAPEGQALLASVRAADPGPGDVLRISAELRRGWPAELVASALTQHELRRAAAAKFTRAGEMLFTRPGLEQASSELLARHRAARLAHRPGLVADLCCGIGGDLLALAAGREALAVDLEPVHLRLAAHNAAVYGAGPVQARQADVREVGLDGVAAAFVDPARRAAGRRLPAGLSHPPLAWCLGLAARVDAVVVKAAPGLPREAAPPGWELELVAAGRGLKEAVLWSPALATVARRATVLPASATGRDPAGHTLTSAPGGGPGPEVPVAQPGAYLLDPNPAVTRAGLVRELASQLGAWKLDEEIAFLSLDQDVRSPFARTLRVLDSAPWNERQLAGRLRAHDVGEVQIRRRGLAGDIDRLQRRLRLDGTLRATLVMTRLRDQPWMLLCADADVRDADT
jgi:SAM-dependent methyltransferase